MRKCYYVACANYWFVHMEDLHVFSPTKLQASSYSPTLINPLLLGPHPYSYDIYMWWSCLPSPHPERQPQCRKSANLPDRCFSSPASHQPSNLVIDILGGFRVAIGFHKLDISAAPAVCSADVVTFGPQVFPANHSLVQLRWPPLGKPGQLSRRLTAGHYPLPKLVEMGPFAASTPANPTTGPQLPWVVHRREYSAMTGLFVQRRRQTLDHRTTWLFGQGTALNEGGLRSNLMVWAQ